MAQLLAHKAISDATIRNFARRLSRHAVRHLVDQEDLIQVGYLARLLGRRPWGLMIEELRRMQGDFRLPHERNRHFVSLTEIEGFASQELAPEFVTSLYHGLAQLPGVWRDIVIREYAGHSAKDISRHTHVSIGSVYQYAHRARNRLSREIK